ncbi:hypothetical protein DMZ48_12745 [Robertkochia solimangrovi]|nr:hypothetical protein DMZ48_12745 [Robertkochia solimangrovi]
MNGRLFSVELLKLKIEVFSKFYRLKVFNKILSEQIYGVSRSDLLPVIFGRYYEQWYGHGLWLVISFWVKKNCKSINCNGVFKLDLNYRFS